MKKLAALLSALIMLFVNAFACGSMSSDILPSSASAAVSSDECTHWVIDSSSRELIGITSPDEAVPITRAYGGTLSHIRGVMSDGIIRVHARASIVISSGTVLGLTPVTGAKVVICPDYADLVAEIVARRTGAELSYQTVIASTLWVSCDTAAHIFFTAKHSVVRVGYVIVGSDTLILWAGDFDHNGDLELGFVAGTNDYYVAPTATPEPTKCPRRTATPEYRTPDPQFVNPTPQPTKCPCSSDTQECVDVYKLCFKLCITLKKCVTETVSQPNCGCK